MIDVLVDMGHCPGYNKSPVVPGSMDAFNTSWGG